MAMESYDYSISVPETASTTDNQPNGSMGIANASSNGDTRAQAGSETPRQIGIITCWSLVMKSLQEKFVQCAPYLQRLEFDGDLNQILNRIEALSVSDSDEVFQRAVKPLADVLHRGAIEKEYFDRLVLADGTSEETIDTTERGNRRPNDQQDLNTNHAIQQNEPCKLSELLSKAQLILNELNPVQLKISEQPKPFWHSRYLTCISNGMCSGLTGRSEDQEKFIFLEWLNLNGFDLEKVFVRAQILTFDGLTHPTKHIVPPGTKVKDAQQNEPFTLKDLLVEEHYGFDERLKELVYRLRPEKGEPTQMNFKVLVFNQPKSERSRRGKDPAWTKIFKIRFQLFHLTEGQLQSISNPIDSELIEESKQTQTLRGSTCKFVPGEPPGIEVVFNTDAEKNGFRVFVNGNELPFHKFSGLNFKKMLIKSDEFANDCHLRITKSSAMETIRNGHDPRKGLDPETLVNQTVRHPRFEQDNQLSANF